MEIMGIVKSLKGYGSVFENWKYIFRKAVALAHSSSVKVWSGKETIKVVED